MSQAKVLALLGELGGRAKSSAIIQRAKEKYPDSSLWRVVGIRLTKLREWGDIAYDNNTQEWYITRQGKDNLQSMQAELA
jgi:hypothetical protein